VGVVVGVELVDAGVVVVAVEVVDAGAVVVDTAAVDVTTEAMVVGMGPVGATQGR